MRNAEIGATLKLVRGMNMWWLCKKIKNLLYLWTHIPSTKNKNYKPDRLLDFFESQILYLLMHSSMTVILKLKQKCR